MSNTVVSVERLSKKYCRSLRRSLYYGLRDISTELVGLQRGSDRLRKGEFWAVDDLSFELNQGESLGLVGSNGSGKTTLLRIIGGLIKPDIGSVKVRGTLAPLIALGAGFSPLLTGRENIYANLAILGLSKQQISSRYESVLAFAQIDEAIDAPVRTYSSGMAARLGFACAVHTEPDVLLVDEVLAVGDIKFKDKCFRKLDELKENGTSIILVSHNPHAVLCTCKTALYLSNGSAVMTGPAGEVLQRYEEDLFLGGFVPTSDQPLSLTLPKKTSKESLGLDILEISFIDHRRRPVSVLTSGKPATVSVRCHIRTPLSDLNLTIVIRDVVSSNNLVLLLSNHLDKAPFDALPGEEEFQLSMPILGLRPSVYTMEVKMRRGALFVLDEVASFRFHVRAGENMLQSLYYQSRQWISKRS